MKHKVSRFSKSETVMRFRQTRQKLKSNFDNDRRDVHVKLPPKLASMWEEQHATSAMRRSSISSWSFDELVVSYDDMRSIFDPVLDRNLHSSKRGCSQFHVIMGRTSVWRKPCFL